MKTTIILLFIAFTTRSCGPFSSLSERDDGMKRAFAVADTTGQERTSFQLGEAFEMSFAITNLTGKDQSYYSTGPTVIFEIRQADSTIASSVDGLAWIQVVLSGRILNGRSEKHEWRAPNSPARNPKIELPPGTYTARAVLRYGFTGVAVAQPSEITFNVVP